MLLFLFAGFMLLGFGGLAFICEKYPKTFEWVSSWLFEDDEDEWDLPLTDCIVCDGYGCEFCPRVVH